MENSEMMVGTIHAHTSRFDSGNVDDSTHTPIDINCSKSTFCNAMWKAISASGIYWCFINVFLTNRAQSAQKKTVPVAEAENAAQFCRMRVSTV